MIVYVSPTTNPEKVRVAPDLAEIGSTNPYQSPDSARPGLFTAWMEAAAVKKPSGLVIFQ